MKLPQIGEKILKMSWHNIKTIAQFDDVFDSVLDNGGHDDHTSRHTEQKNISELTAAKPETTTSLLIESLIHLLCKILENDANLANESYKAICEQLKRINLIDDSYAMNEFEDMRGQYQMQIYKIICAVRGEDIPVCLPFVGNNSQSVETCWSRYYREFDEISYIAAGGFGKVYKARHKLDCIEYAVKQIKINSTTIKLCHLAEVKTIASLNHPNIVQYKAAWLEPFVPKKSNMISKEESEYESTEPPDTDITTSESDINPNHHLSTYNRDDESSDFIQFEHSSSELNSKNNSTTNDNRKLCIYGSHNSMEYFRPKANVAILYIQMSLCQITLQKWLKDRNGCDSFQDYYMNFYGHGFEPSHIDIVNDIFCQILSGLNYIHSRDIVHHDIKPSNIFLGLENDGKLAVQLGDFGLACPLQNHRGIPFGTPLYAAPEQLDGICNPKSDIYSLGIVLLELLVKFSTDMERSRTIEKARMQNLPSELNKEFTKLLKSLLSNVANRPNTKELLNVLRAINLEQDLRACNLSKVDSTNLKDIKIKELKQEINVLHDNTIQHETEILRLLKELESKDRQIRELKILLDKKDEEITKLSVVLDKSETI